MTDLIHLATLLQTYYLSHSHLLPTLNTLLIGISAIVFSYYAGKLFSEGWDVPVMQWHAPEVSGSKGALHCNDFDTDIYAMGEIS